MSDTETSETGPLVAQPGAFAQELQTESNDPEELRLQLARARERLSFYERFDHLIGENLRQSGELMQEAIAMRERVAWETAGGGHDDRSGLAAGLQEIARRVAELGSLVERIAADVDGPAPPRASGSGETGAAGESLTEMRPRDADPVAPVPPAPAVQGTGGASQAASGAAVAPVPQPGNTGSSAPVEPPLPWPEPRTVEVIAQPVNQAATALALQRYLTDLEPVVGVEAREFAGGVLRLQVTSKRELVASDLRGWNAGGALGVRHSGPGLLHLGVDDGA